MPPRADPRVHTSTRLTMAIVVSAAMATLAFASGPALGHVTNESHPHIVVDVGDRQGDVGSASISWTGDAFVHQDGSGTYIDIPVPDDTTIGHVTSVGTTEGDLPGSGISSVEPGPAGGTVVRWRWGAGAPDNGSTVENVHLTLSVPIAFQPDARLVWSAGLAEDTGVTVTVPSDLTIVTNGGLTKNYHSSQQGAESYSTILLSQDHLRVDIRQVGSAPDPARAHPAWGGWGWTIVILIGAGSGAIWWAGHRADERRQKE